MVSEVRRLHSTEQRARLSLVLGNPSSEPIARLSVTYDHRTRVRVFVDRNFVKSLR